MVDEALVSRLQARGVVRVAGVDYKINTFGPVAVYTDGGAVWYQNMMVVRSGRVVAPFFGKEL